MKALAERYAGALVDVALENKQADQVKKELAAFAAMVRESPELHAFLSNPSIARTSKHAAIEQLVARRIAWGIVTNKATRFTSPLVRELAVTPACVVCGDSTPHLKPHPAPLLLAAKELDLPPADCVYVGDDLRDIQAARAAGMRCVAVEYGYHGADNPGPQTWNADAIISHPRELLEHL